MDLCWHTAVELEKSGYIWYEDDEKWGEKNVRPDNTTNSGICPLFSHR